MVGWPGPEDQLLVREGLLCLRCVVGNWVLDPRPWRDKVPHPPPPIVEGLLWRGKGAPGSAEVPVCVSCGNKDGPFACCLASPSLPLPPQK